MFADGASIALFFQGFFGQMMGYFTVVGLFYLFVWKWGAQRFKGLRIQATRRADRRQILFEVKNTIIVLVAGSPMMLLGSWLYSKGFIKLTMDANSIGIPMIALTFFGLILFNDLWFYCWHRLLHHPKLFRLVHSVHHKSVDVNPFTSYSFHWFEAFVLGAWVLPVALIVPVYIPMLGALSALGLANNVMAHTGYEFLPRWLMKVPVLKYMNTATFHSMHHTGSRGNFGLMTRLWDRLFGTELPDYEKTFVQRGAALK
jgi:sterol desaturase/sphingolipid hydroxylase (fatty acid hydroxylase superfamily)